MEPRGNPKNPMPKPPTGALNGPDGTMMRKGSAGRMGINEEYDEGCFDPTTEDRCNPSSLDSFN